MSLNIPDEVKCEVQDNRIRFCLNAMSTDWMDFDDSFTKRLDNDNLNDERLVSHLEKEIEIRNILDEGIAFFESGKYLKAIEDFDNVLFYDPDYGRALLYKSYSLRGQRHFVKSLRYYKHAVKADSSLKDIDYHKALLSEANSERDNFPKLKLNIYAGDEYFARGEFSKAVESYNRALINPSKFKDKIHSKLLNKKATALLNQDNFNEALECFRSSQTVGMNDYAVFGEGYCEYRLGLDICDGFKKRLNISKKQMLVQADALNDLGYFSESLEISDFLYKNHFKVDDFYLKLLDIRKSSMDKSEV